VPFEKAVVKSTAQVEFSSVLPSMEERGELIVDIVGLMADQSTLTA